MIEMDRLERALTSQRARVASLGRDYESAVSRRDYDQERLLKAMRTEAMSLLSQLELMKRQATPLDANPSSRGGGVFYGSNS